MQQSEKSINSIVLQLLSKALFDKEYDVDMTESINWKNLYQESEAQAIIGVVAGVLDDKTLTIPKEVKTEWTIKVVAHIGNFHKILSYQTQAIQSLETHKIPVVILKGAVAAANYPTPEYRMMGDIDLLVLEEHFSVAKAYLLDLVYVLNERLGGPDEESGQKHVILEKDGIILELHQKPFHIQELQNDEYLNAYMTEGFKQIEMLSVSGYAVPSLPPAQNALEFLLHIQSHMRGSGIGMRQISDWALFANKYLKDDDYERDLRLILRSSGLETFACVLTRMCQIYLGLPENNMSWCMEADEETCAMMLEYIMQQGNFGTKAKDDYVAKAVAKVRHPIRSLKALQQSALKRWPDMKERAIAKRFAFLRLLLKYLKYAMPCNRELAAEVREGMRRSILFERLELFQSHAIEEPKMSDVLIVLIRDVLHNSTSNNVLETVDETQVQGIIEYAAEQGLFMFLQEHSVFRKYLQQEKFKKKTMSSLYLCTLQTEELKHILDAFEKNQISCLMLKGSRSRELYPKAELRSMGDIDLLYKPEQTKDVQLVMGQLGYGSNGDTAKHDHYAKKLLTVEMHKSLCIPEWKEYQYFEAIWDRVNPKEGYRYVNEMTLEDHYLYTFTHLLEHFRSGGIGIRMVLDMYVLAQIEEIDWKYVDKILEAFGYQEFHRNIRRLSEVWFEDNQKGQIPKELRALADYIMQGGVFGNPVHETTNLQLQYKGRGEFLRKIVFPGYQTMKTVYPWLNTRLLLPVAWVMRWIQALTSRRGHVKKQIKRARAFGKGKQNLENRKKFFESVGLH